MEIQLKLGDCIEVLKTLPENSVDSIVTDPPYGIGFMNKEWDDPKKHKELINREARRSQERFDEGKSPVKGGFSKGVQPGLPIGGAREGRWFQEWCELWAAECFRVLKPGGYILSFSAPRTYHRMTTAFEEVGFEIRDQLMWLFGSGFPKSLNIGKAIDKLEGNEREVIGNYIGPDGKERKNNKLGVEYNTEFKTGFKENRIKDKGQTEWEGWGTALKPAHEPIVMARKPLSEKTNAENVLKWGTGGINIDGSRIATDDKLGRDQKSSNEYAMLQGGYNDGYWDNTNGLGRFPANVLIDEEAAQMIDEQSGISKSNPRKTCNRRTNSNHEYGFKTDAYSPHNDEGGASRFFKKVKIQKGTRDYTKDTWGLKVKDGHESPIYDDEGGPSRFFYCAKVSKKERNMGLDYEKEVNKRPTGVAFNEEGHIFQQKNGNFHPTVKPIKLMEYLIKLVTRKGGLVLDPFLGSGSTGMAAKKNGYNFIGIEKEQDYLNIAECRIGSINQNQQLNLFEDAGE